MERRIRRVIDQIEKPKIERVEIGESSKYGKFIVNPLERGFGQTLGNVKEIRY